MINRCAVTIRAKEQFLGWLLSLPDYDDLTLDQVNEETTTYLLPVYETDSEKAELLEQYFAFRCSRAGSMFAFTL